MIGRIESCIEALVRARPNDYDNDTILVLREELVEKVDDYTADLKFEITGDSRKAELRLLTQ
jgi:hypothetical protein